MCQSPQTQYNHSGVFRLTFFPAVSVHFMISLFSLNLYPGGFSLSTYMMYIYIGAGAAGLVLLVAIIVLVVIHR